MLVNPEMIFHVFSIFFSISGEVGRWPQGTPVIFIRLAGCNLRCSYCDTEKSLPMDSGEDMSLRDIIAALEKYPSFRVLVTGGEPLAQKNVGALFQALRSQGYQIAVETNGSISLTPTFITEPDIFWIVDYKMPGSGQFEKMKVGPSDYQRLNVQMKFVCKDEIDVKVAADIIKRCQYFSHPPALSAACDLSPGRLWSLMVEHGLLNCVLNLQIHKYIWPGAEEER